MEMVRLKPAQMPWLMMLRTALAVPAGLAVGLASGYTAQGVLASLGAMATAMVDRAGPLRQRMVRQVCGFSGGAVGMVAGHAFGSPDASSIVVWTALGAVSGLVSVISGAASVLGLQLLVQAAISNGLQLPLPLWQLPLWAALGGAWTLLLTVVIALVAGLRVPEREAVAEVYRQVAAVLGSVGAPPPRMVGATTLRAGAPRHPRVEAREELTTAVNQAYDKLVTLRSRQPGRSREFQELAGLLNATTTLLDAAVAVAHTERPAPDGYRACVEAIADTVLVGGPPPRLPDPVPAEPGEQRPQEERLTVRELRSVLSGVLDQLTPEGAQRPDEPLSSTRSRPSPRQRFARVLDELLTGPQTWAYVARLALCLGTAETLRTYLPMERSYWMLLTTAIVMKPDFSSVFVRAVHRGAGTLIGVVVGGAVVELINPSGPLLIALMMLFIGTVPAVQGRNYGIFTVFLTPFALLLVSTRAQAGSEIIQARLLDTLVGCGICLVLGHLLWPETWRPLVGRSVADATDAVAGYLRVAFTPEAPRTAQRRKAFRKLSDVRTQLQRTLAEPPALKQRSTAWWPMLVQLERTADAITLVSTQVRVGQTAADQEMVRQLAEATEDLAAALREHRKPAVGRLPYDTGPLPVIGGGQHEETQHQLEPIAREVRTARRMAAA